MKHLMAVALAMAACGQPEAAPVDPKVERGRYLANHVSLCVFCHSPVDWKTEGFPVVAGQLGAGAPFPDESIPGKVYAGNLTSDKETGIGAWSDEELRRAIRRGVGRDGRALFPAMPFASYSAMSDDDVNAIIAYLRTLPAVKRPNGSRELPPPIEQMLKPLPEGGPVAAPDRSTPAKRGAYLARIADCISCHTPVNGMGMPVTELAYSGGFTLKGPWGRVASSNLTPDPSGLPYYDDVMFLGAFQRGNPGGRKLNAIMPWGHYAGMAEEDALAIYEWMKTLPKVKHRVDNVEEPTPCKRCGGSHGLGRLN
jgi:mono/diheme cytochrome c family protein